MRKIDKIILEENMVKEVKIDWRKDIAKEKIIIQKIVEQLQDSSVNLIIFQ